MTARREIVCFMLFGVVIFAVGIVGGILIGIYAYHGGPDAEVTCKNVGSSSQLSAGTTKAPTSSYPTQATTSVTKGSDNEQCIICPRAEPRQKWTGEHPEIFAPLTEEEMTEVYTYLVNQNIVTTESFTLDSNYVHTMYLFLPEKEAVLKYQQGVGPYPGRYAHVHIFRGNRTDPDYMEFKVGPLDGSPMTATQLYQDGALHFNSRPYEGVEISAYFKLLKPVFETLAPLTKESFDGAYYPDTPDLSFWFYNGPPGVTAAERETKFVAILNPLAQNEYDYLLTDFLPLTGTIYCPGIDVSKWYVYGLYYLNQGPFNNATALIDAYNRNTIRKVSYPKGYRDTVLDRSLPDRDMNAPFRRKSHIPPPRTYEPGGPRYTISGHHVEWMGWNFQVSSGQLRGPGVYLVTFKGESIAYEIALNEIVVTYGSGSSAQTNVFYTDAMYGIGENYGIIPTVDCPEHGTLLEVSHWQSGNKKAVVTPAICVFEADGQNALWRHNGQAYEGGLRNTYLVVRYTTTIVNYDYIIEWNFFLDGKLFTQTSASGHIQGGFWDADNPFMGLDKSRDAFGYHVSDYMQGLVHDHMFGFKVDLDILGTENTMEVIHWRTGDPLTAIRSQVPATNQVPSFFQLNETKYLEYEYVEREVGNKIRIDEPKLWIVVNENTTNKWGVKRGYQLKPMTTTVQTFSDSHPGVPGISFTKYHSAVTKRKENEKYIDSTTDSHRFDKSLEYVDKMLDNEYIRNTDIVHWVTTGFYHVPTAEDVPMTTRVSSGFMLKPFNFFDKTEVFDMQAYLNTEGNWRTERPPTSEPCLEPNNVP